MSNHPRNLSENINYKNFTNSSALCWRSSSACGDSLASIIKDKRIILAGGISPDESTKPEPVLPPDQPNAH